MGMFGKILFGMASAFVCIGLIAPMALAAESQMPVESSLEAEPSVITWPSQTEFEYRLTVRSGPDGADFRFRFPWQSWGPADVGGSPFTSGETTLEGPGELKSESVLVADPSPTSCYRGGFTSTLYSYRLILDPNTTTVLKMPSRLTASAVTGMDMNLEAEISGDGPEHETLSAPITINGPQGVRIIGKVSGADQYSNATKRPRQAFRISGRTIPAISNQPIRFRAEPRMWSGQGEPPKARNLTATFTRPDGRFRTRPLRLNREATWILTSRLTKPGAYDNTQSCNGTLTIDDGFEPATFEDLDGKSFVSTSIKGPGKKPKKIEIGFSESEAWWELGEAAKEIVPVIGLNAGCNSMGGTYQIENGRLGSKMIYSTAMACFPDHSGWITSKLRKGMYASTKGRRLILENRKTRIRFRQIR